MSENVLHGNSHRVGPEHTRLARRFQQDWVLDARRWMADGAKSSQTSSTTCAALGPPRLGLTRTATMY